MQPKPSNKNPEQPKTNKWGWYSLSKPLCVVKNWDGFLQTESLLTSVSWVKLNLGIFHHRHFLATFLTRGVMQGGSTKTVPKFIKSERVDLSLDFILCPCLCFIYVIKIILAISLQKLEDYIRDMLVTLYKLESAPSSFL